MRRIVGKIKQYLWWRTKRWHRHEKLFYFYTSLRYKYQQKRYTAPAHPYKNIFISPNQIKYRKSMPIELGFGQIRGGDWDLKNIKNIEDFWVYKGLLQRFKKSLPWEETIYYKKVSEKFKNGSRYVSEYENITEYKNIRLSYLDNLFSEIKKNGYRPNSDSKHITPVKDTHRDRPAQQFEPIVAIGRSGDMFLLSGYHRFTIAKILEIDPIPVNVLIRHTEWQHIRDRLNNSDTIDIKPDLKNVVDHPDLDEFSFE